MEMVENRIQTTHTYNYSVARDIAKEIINKYHNQFKELESKLEKLAEDNA
jgi:hypothetical protein